jgi:hypothetical protein
LILLFFCQIQPDEGVGTVALFGYPTRPGSATYGSRLTGLTGAYWGTKDPIQMEPAPTRLDTMNSLSPVSNSGSP